MTTETFLQITNVLPEPSLLITRAGAVLAANRAAGEHLGLYHKAVAGRQLAQLVSDSVETVEQYLLLCTQSDKLVPGALTLHGRSNEGIPCRAEGAVVQPLAASAEPLILLRLIAKPPVAERFVALTQRIEELDREMHRRQEAEEELRRQGEWLRVTLSSIGDAVIATDAQGHVTFLNAVAETLTGWTQADARGVLLTDVFHIVNEHTREPTENPALRALHEGAIVGLANHTVLIARGGTERPIDDSAAPIRQGNDDPVGAVLVFRDVTERKRAETARARLAAIVESSDDAIVSKDLNGIILSWNASAERIFGWTAAGAIGQSITLIIPSNRLDEERVILGRLRQGERIDHFETVRAHKDGRLIDISLTVSPVRDEAGRVVAASKVARDITERKAVEAAARDETRTVETLNAIGTRLVAELDLTKLLQTVTDETTVLTGATFGAFFYNLTGPAGKEYVLSALTGASRSAFETFPHPRSTAIFEPTFSGHAVVRLDDVTADPRYGNNAPYQGMPEGHLPVRSYLAVPVKSQSGEVLGGLFFGHPRAGIFTARHERLVAGVAAQAAVAVDNARLYERLRDQDRKKDDFIALLAHELRNPLAPIRNGLQVIRLSDDRATRERSQAMMDRQLAHMVRMIDDLLDVSRIGRHKMELRRTRVSLSDVVASAVETTGPAIEEAGHELSVTLPSRPVHLDADLTRLSQVFSNLLANSVKYTPRGGLIRLTAERTDGSVIVSVQDTGVGIPTSALPRIFDMFSQVDRPIERSTGGLGIGLALVKGLVEMHGGTVTATSDGPGSGSTFTVTLPALDAPTPTVTVSDAVHDTTHSGQRILVVDDNRDGAESLAEMLKLLGNEVWIAHDGLEAVKQAERFRPEVILMDVGMPRLNGLEATRRIREQPWGANVTIIALTGWGQESDRERSREAGCDGHLVKPVNLSDLEHILADK